MTQTRGIGPAQIAERRSALVHFVLFATVIAALRWPFAWTGNEENYFLLSRRLVEPSAYGPLDAVFDSSRGKWVGLLSFGWTTRLFGFETAHFLLGLVTTAVTAAGLAALARMIRLELLPAIAALLLFLVLGQSIPGSEWFVGAVETKTIAYGLGLVALAVAWDGRPRFAAVLVAVAAYFHFLVGGFWLLAVAVFLGLDPEGRNSFKSFLSIALILLVPLLLFLLADVRNAAATPQPAGMPTADVIYSILRSPHHVAPFDGPKPWGLKAVAAAILALILAPAFWLVAPRTGGALRPLLRMIAVTVLLLPIAVVASWFDRHHGALGKFYLFRPVSPLLLLVLFAFTALAQLRFQDRRWLPFAWAAIAVGSLASILISPRMLRWPARDPDVGPMVAAIRSRTSPAQVVLIDPQLDTAAPYLDGPSASSLARKLDRPMFVSWKFVPTYAADIYRWYGRLKQRDQLFGESCPGDPRVGALVLAPGHLRLHPNCGVLVYEDRQAAVLLLQPLGAAHSPSSNATPAIGPRS